MEKILPSDSHLHADFKYPNLPAYSVTSFMPFPNRSVSIRQKSRYRCVFLFPYFWWASVSVIALSNSWFADRLWGSRWAVIVTSHAGSADGKRTPYSLLNPVTLLALSQPFRVTCSDVIPTLAAHWLSHTESPAVGPPSRWLRPQQRTERRAQGIALPGYVFLLTLSVLTRGCASEALLLITFRSGLHGGKVVWLDLQTRPHKGGEGRLK